MRKLILLAVLAFGVHGQEMQLPRASGPITLDGDLSDPGWQNALVLDKFYEYFKTENGEPSVKTIVHVAYDDKYFYVGIDCRDPEPSKIRAPLGERDQVFGDQDNVAVMIDARGEGKVSLELRVNPSNVQGDALNNDATGAEDFSPDYFYDTATKITPQGWIAEYRIPLSTLRYKESDPKTFGFNVLRTWPRTFRESVTLVPFPRNSNCFVCHQIKLTGISGLPSSQHLVAAPYVTSQRLSEPSGALGTPLDHHSLDNNAGIDVKWGPTSDTVLDATINPDFSQIEADVAQITTNQRFAVFFPEKRPFFLEGFDLFDTPIQAVYTRTITSPRWGMRATGKNGSTEWTTLIADDRGGGLLIVPGSLGSDFAPQDFHSYAGIARVRHELGKNAVGALVTTREYDGNAHNRVIGPDFEWRPTDKDQVTGQYLFSSTKNPLRPDLSGAFDGSSANSHAARVRWNHNTREHDWFAIYQDFGDGFRADNGFVPQVGFHDAQGGGGLNWYPKNSFFTSKRFYANGEYTTDTSSNLIFQDANAGVSFTGAHYSQGNIELHPKQKVRTGAGDLLSQTYAFWFVRMNPSKRWAQLQFQGNAGEAIDFANSRPGRGWDAQLVSAWKPTDHVTLTLVQSMQTLSTKDVPNAGHLFTSQVSRVKVLYNFTASSLLRVIGQYVKTTRDVDRYTFPVARRSGNFLGSLLYTYRINWQTVLFVGYGDDRVLNERADLLRADRSLFVKVSYAIQR
jgi:hypothetical protein